MAYVIEAKAGHALITATWGGPGAGDEVSIRTRPNPDKPGPVSWDEGPDDIEAVVVAQDGVLAKIYEVRRRVLLGEVVCKCGDGVHLVEGEISRLRQEVQALRAELAAEKAKGKGPA